MAPKTPVILLSLVASTLASPAGSPLEARATVTPAPTALGTAIGGAMDTTASRSVKHGVMLAAGPEYLTLEVTNSCGWPISTSHVSNAGCPTAISGGTGTGTIAVGGVGTVVVPTDYAGNIAIDEWGTGYEVNGDDSLIEFNYVQDSEPYAVADVDVSYVNGFSLPIICWCDGAKVSGCTENLWALNTCPNDDGVGACANPLRASLTATAPTTFFEPCAGQAYTFPNDNAANSWGACQNGVISCCVGATC